MATLSNANSSFLIGATGLYPVPQKMQGYSTDDAFSVGDVSPVQVFMGVDGKMSYGYVPFVTEVTIMLQADSPSIAMFDRINEAQKANNEAIEMFGTLVISGTGEKYAFAKGVITSLTPVAAGKKTLQPRKVTITFETATKSAI